MKRPLLHWPDITAPRPGAPASPWWMRLLWMAGIWAASTSALLAVAMLLRLVLRS